MKNKGFTLIELLAVIVILAIIALIATPIILGIINDARKESNQRSVELYASAVKNGIAAHQLTGSEVPAGTYTKDTLPFDVDVDGKVECNTIDIYKDGSFYITDCKVNDTAVEYTSGTKKYEPQYYGDWNFSGLVDEIFAPEKPSKIPPTNRNFYLGYDVDSNNFVSAAYVCFVRNSTEYCLKGKVDEAFTTNKTIIADAFKDVLGTDECYVGQGDSNCYASGLSIFAESYGYVRVGDDNSQCYINDDGIFECIE